MKQKEGRDYLELTRCNFFPGSDLDAGLFVFATTCEAFRLTPGDMKRVVKFVAAHGIGGKKSNSPQHQHQPLTDEQVMYIVDVQRAKVAFDTARVGYRVARAIERAHGIGSHK